MKRRGIPGNKVRHVRHSLSKCGDMNTQYVMYLFENQVNLPLSSAAIATF